VTNYQKQQIAPILLCGGASEMTEDDLDIPFVDVHNENLLNSNHNEMPYLYPHSEEFFVHWPFYYSVNSKWSNFCQAAYWKIKQCQ
jgi:hypothetical protein